MQGKCRRQTKQITRSVDRKIGSATANTPPNLTYQD